MRYWHYTGYHSKSGFFFQHPFGSPCNRGQERNSGNGYGCGSHYRNRRNAIHESETDEEQQEQHYRNTEHRIVFARNELLGCDFRFRQRLLYQSWSVNNQLIRWRCESRNHACSIRIGKHWGGSGHLFPGKKRLLLARRRSGRLHFHVDYIHSNRIASRIYHSAKADRKLFGFRTHSSESFRQSSYHSAR